MVIHLKYSAHPSSFFSLQSITFPALSLTTDVFRVFFPVACCFLKCGCLHINPVLPDLLCAVFYFLVLFSVLALAFLCLGLIFHFLSISAMFDEFTRSWTYPALVLTGLVAYGLLCCSVDCVTKAIPFVIHVWLG